MYERAALEYVNDVSDLHGAAFMALQSLLGG